MRRVAVTTAVDTAHRVARLLHLDQLEPVMLPCIRIVAAPIEALERLRAAARDADWIVVTSPRAVHVTWPEGGMPSLPVAAVVGQRGRKHLDRHVSPEPRVVCTVDLSHAPFTDDLDDLVRAQMRAGR